MNPRLLTASCQGRLQERTQDDRPWHGDGYMVVPNPVPVLPSFLLNFCLCLPQCIKCSSSGSSHANCFPYNKANSGKYLVQNSLSPPPLNFQHRPPTLTPLILSLQNTKTGDGHFSVLLVWVSPKLLCFLRSRGCILSCTFTLLELAFWTG